MTLDNLDCKLHEALENPVVYDFAIDLEGKRIYAPVPNKYLEGKPVLQKGRMYDVTLGFPQEAVQKSGSWSNSDVFLI